MYNSIFQKEWWLEAVAPGQWSVAEVKQGDDILARWPFTTERKNRGIVVTQPLLTQTLGPWLRSSKGKYANKLGEEKDLMVELVKKLPVFDEFYQSFHYSITNWLPLYWLGFKQTTKYTYVIEELSDLNKVWDGFLANIRTDIKKAQNRFGIEVCNDLGIEAFLDINEQTFARQGQSLPYSRDFVKRLDEACVAHNARKIFFARDKEGRIHAAVYIVWDEHSAYNLMVGSDPALRNSGATSLCMWEAIKFASTVTCRFDFEGSMMEPIERFYRAFGAKQIPYFSVTKTNSRLALLRQAMTLIKKSIIRE